MRNYLRRAFRLRELRELARVKIHEAAALLGISYTGLWNLEHGHGKFTDRQIELLECFYIPKVNERLKRISQLFAIEK
jgi:transcriptional regulator with XRE-family HTH domain